MSASEPAPALVPAYKFSCASALNPTPVNVEPSPENDVAVKIPVTTAPVLVVSNFLAVSV